ncbi:hypothetical protein B0H13DRAFT_1913336, partial [Mycena leptocephala]
RNSADLCIYHAVAAFVKYNLKPAPPSRISWFQKLIGSLTKSLKTSNELRGKFDTAINSLLVRDTLAHFPQTWPMADPRMSTKRSKSLKAELPVVRERGHLKWLEENSKPAEEDSETASKIVSLSSCEEEHSISLSICVPNGLKIVERPCHSPGLVMFKLRKSVLDFGFFFETNKCLANAIIAACAKSLKTKYPRVVRRFLIYMQLMRPVNRQQGDRLETNSGRFELIAAICICAEQTSRAGITGSQPFSLTFSKALDAYMKPSFRNEVVKQIEKLKAEDFLVSHHVQDTPAVVPKLVEIITARRLRP